MKKIALALVLIAGSMEYVVVERGMTERAQAEMTRTTADVPAVSVPSVTPTTTWTPTTMTVPTPVKPTPVPQPIPAPAPTGRYKDGTYTGAVVDAYYGNIQVAAVVFGGALTSIKVLQYPNDRGTSIEINKQALPVLIQEAISAQSANINGISGASETSPSFIESLTSALAKA